MSNTWLLLLIVGSIVCGYLMRTFFGDSDVFKNNKELDTTLSVIFNYATFFLLAIGLLAGELFFDKQWLTEALIHTIIGYICGWIQGQNQTFFTRKATQTDQTQVQSWSDPKQNQQEAEKP